MPLGLLEYALVGVGFASLIAKARRKYFEFVPIGLRDAAPQAAVDLGRSLALMKAGPSADFKYDYQAMISNDEMSRFAKEHEAVAEEWIAWAKSNSPGR
jgi:hypothetical protein